MSSAKISLLGLYHANKSIFDLLTLPDGIDKDTLVDNILLKSADFEILYSDPNFIQYAIGMWSVKWQRTFKKWVDALNIDYAPLENYDRKEDWSEDTTHGHTTTNIMEGKLSGTESNNGTTNNNKSAFDSSSLQPYEQTTVNNGTTTGSTANETTTNKLDESQNIQHTTRAHGNIGVTTSQQMLEAELNISAWNVYEHITDLFLNEFCILVY